MKKEEITIIKLLNNISEDKIVPKQIKYLGIVYTFDTEDKTYYDENGKTFFQMYNFRILKNTVEILSEENEMKEMVYQKDRKNEILYNGTYKGYEFYIMNLGAYPTAYVNVENNFSLNRKCYDEINIDVHGGLTYSRDNLFINDIKKISGWFIGWDYAHYNDYDGYEMNLPKEIRSNGKKWTTKEIYEDVKSVIEQCINYKENDEWEDIESYDIKVNNGLVEINTDEHKNVKCTHTETVFVETINQLIKNQKHLKEKLESKDER